MHGVERLRRNTGFSGRVGDALHELMLRPPNVCCAVRELRDAACCWKCGLTWSNSGALVATTLMASGMLRDKRRIAFSCFPNKACAHQVQLPKVFPSWAKPRPIPLFLLSALLSCCGFTVKTVPVSPAKSSHDRDSHLLPPPGRTPKDRAFSGTGPAVSSRKSAISPTKSSSLFHLWQNPLNPAPILYSLLHCL